jgi:hypothetical protein
MNILKILGNGSAAGHSALKNNNHLGLSVKLEHYIILIK